LLRLPRDLNVSVNPFDYWTDEELAAAIERMSQEIRAKREDNGEEPETIQ